MAIGTAKPSLEEQEGIKHYFIDSHSIFEPLTSAQFEKQALVLLEEEFKQHHEIILVGGSGMFIEALCQGLDNIPFDLKLRDELNVLVENQGLSVLLEELKSKDLDFYEQIDQQNPVRIIRAIEAIRLTGQKYSELRKKQAAERSFESIYFTIDLPRDLLYERINKRADLMLDAGLLDEVKALKAFRHLQSLNTVGYKEFFDYLDGKCSFESAVEQMKQNSRRYAKRQLTWFRRNPENVFLKSGDSITQMEEILSKL